MLLFFKERPYSVSGLRFWWLPPSVAGIMSSSCSLSLCSLNYPEQPSAGAAGIPTTAPVASLQAATNEGQWNIEKMSRAIAVSPLAFPSRLLGSTQDILKGCSELRVKTSEDLLSKRTHLPEDRSTEAVCTLPPRANF